MAAQQLLIRRSEELARGPKRQVPARHRSAFVQHLLEHALAAEGGEDDPLYQAALEVEKDERLMSEMADSDGTVADGLEAERSKAQRGCGRPPHLPSSRGEVWWVGLDPACGSEIRETRPAVVLSADAWNRARMSPTGLVANGAGPKARPNPATGGRIAEKDGQYA